MKNSYSIVDFHAHVLPCADHGSDSLQTTIKQLSFASKFGVDRIIATPHFYPTLHNVDSFIQRRNLAYSKLMDHDLKVDVRLGAEVLICNGIESLPGLENLFIKGTNTILLELPFSDFQSGYCDSVYNLRSRDIDVILAHADRYDPENIEMLLSLGAKIQLNADSLLSIFKKRHLYNWLDRGYVVALGSDIHGPDKNAYKNFSKAINKISEYIPFIKEKSDKIFLCSDAK